MKYSILFCLFVFIAVPILLNASDDIVAPEWKFDDKEAKDELEKWGGINQLDTLEIKEVKDSQGNTRSVLITSSQGGDPYFFPGGEWNSCNYEPFDGSEYDTLYMGVRVNAPNDWQIYYITEEDATWGEAQRQNVTVDSTDKFADMEIQMTRGGWNERTVVRFRIDPGTAANIESEIDYISFIGNPYEKAAVDSSEKLPVVWGNIKQ